MNLKNLNDNKVQAVVLYVATLIGIVMGLGSSIINTRFLDPSDYGDVRYVQNIINLISTLLCFGYFLSGSRLLALSKDSEEKRSIRGMMVIILALSVLILIIACFFVPIFSSMSERVRNLFWISIPVCASPLLVNYIDTTAQGDNQILRLSLARMLPPLIYVPSAFYVYSTFGSSASLMILLQWGLYVVILSLIIASTNPGFKNLRSSMAKLNSENKAYGIQLYYGSLVMVATNYIAGITIGAVNTDNVEVGFYTLALTVTGPLAKLPEIIGTTYFQKFATQDRIPQKILMFTVFITILSCIIFIAIIHPLVTFVYSEAYSKVGTYASILAIGYSVHGFGDMINRYLGSHGQGTSIRNSSIANGCFKVFGYTVLVYLWNTNGALATTVICDFIYMLMLMYYYRKFIKK